MTVESPEIEGTPKKKGSPKGIYANLPPELMKRVQDEAVTECRESKDHLHYIVKEYYKDKDTTA